MTVLPALLLSAQEHLEFNYPEASAMVFSNLGSGDGEKALPDLGKTGQTVMSSLGLLSGISLVPLLLFFGLLSRGALRAQASEILSVFQAGTRRKTLYFLDVFIEYVTTFFQGQLIIAVSMATLYAMSFTLIGLKYGVVIGMILGLLNIVPFLGSLIGLLVVLPMAYLQSSGGAELLGLTGLVFAAVQLVESWLLTPRIMANRSGLHPALVIISLFFWGTALDGVIGMILAVPLTAFIVAIWSEIKESLRHTLSNEEATQ
jgi:predicted PurR-regulated permease PerM